MRIPKQYGQSKIENCPFCGKRATTVNSQEVPVCSKHKSKELKDLKCICGEWLDVKTGKWGPYFFCIQCGNISFRKVIEVNPQVMHQDEEKNQSNNTYKEDESIKKQKEDKKEIIVSSDEVDFI